MCGDPKHLRVSPWKILRADEHMQGSEKFCSKKKKKIHLNLVQPSVSFCNINHIKEGGSWECTLGNAVLGQARKSVSKFL